MYRELCIRKMHLLYRKVMKMTKSTQSVTTAIEKEKREMVAGCDYFVVFTGDYLLLVMNIILCRR